MFMRRLSTATAPKRASPHRRLSTAAAEAPKRASPHRRPDYRPLSFDENLELRQRHLSPSLKAHYASSSKGPLKLAAGRGQYLYDVEGDEYLDCVNNVCHVGHCHPRVVQAASSQLATLNTNSRYLHDNIVRLAAQVTAIMPDPLEVAIFVNSGTEANDLALRLARAHTGRKDVYCVDGAYHGNSATTLAISPYNKYAPVEAPSDVVKLMSPDMYKLGLSEAETTKVALAEYEGHLAAWPPAAFIVESLICCGGQIVLPEGYLAGMHALTRQHGGVAIADEVQTGFGRVGSHMWGFEAHGAVPDIVTLGKPFGNGFPLSAVVTTRDIAESSQIEYFNTFGGNPVACAIGLEVLSVIEDEGLQANARRVGALSLGLLRGLTRHERVGDVRGMGLLMGVELVKDRTTKEPDAEAAAHVMNYLRTQCGVLISTDGPGRNVLKMKPPICFSEEDAHTLHNALDEAIAAYEPEA